MNSNNRSNDPFADLLGLGTNSNSTNNSNINSSLSFGTGTGGGGGQFGIGLYDYTAQALNQVTIRKGERIKIVKAGPAGGWSEGTNSLGNLLFV